MLNGTKSLEELLSKPPQIRSFDIDPVVLHQVEVLQLQYEISSEPVLKLLPPALHPTLPPLGIWTAWSVSDSPWGSFNLVLFRISCRSGSRPRTFLASGAIDNAMAQEDLASRWGITSILADIRFSRHYEAAMFCVCFDAKCVLEVQLKNPESLSTNDVQFFASMHGAETPVGLRLVQFDPQFEVHRAERYRPKLSSFNAQAWFVSEVEPVYPVTSFGCNTSIHLPKLRFLCKPDVNAFKGSEII